MESSFPPKPFNLDDTVAGVLDRFQKRLSGEPEVSGLTTGYPEIDKVTGGLKPGELHVIAEDSGVGGITLMMNIAEHVCIGQRVPAMVASCGHTSAELVELMIFSRARYKPHWPVIGIAPTSEELERVRQAASDTRGAPLIVYDTLLTIEALCAEARRLKEQDDIGFLAIDHLQLLRSDSMQAKTSRKRMVAEIMCRLKSLARELHIPILLLAGLNRGPERRKGKKYGVPRFTDIRSVKTVGRYADVIGTLHHLPFYRESFEDNRGMPVRLNLFNLHHGSYSEVPLAYHNWFWRFDPARGDEWDE
jgi:replicative DNA helicase